MTLRAVRNKGETWREAVARIASKHGLEHECLEAFDAYCAQGDDDWYCAWRALYDWDCLDLAAYGDAAP